MDAESILMASYCLVFLPLSITMEDRLAALLARFDLRAQVFHKGALCRHATFSDEQGVGYLHVLKSGAMTVQGPGHPKDPPLLLQQPSLLFYLQPTTHRLQPDPHDPPELVCGSIDFGAGAENPIMTSVNGPVVIPLADQQRLALTLELLFTEAFHHDCGQQAALDRLCELLVIQILRHLMEQGQVQIGLLAGLADPRLSLALNAIHAEPALPWTLDSLADKALMSRARFAVNFREVVGMTPGDYLTRWRLGLAQSLLRKGKPVGLVAHEVGYSGAAALSRAFVARHGVSPRQWMRGQDR